MINFSKAEKIVEGLRGLGLNGLSGNVLFYFESNSRDRIEFHIYQLIVVYDR